MEENKEPVVEKTTNQQDPGDENVVKVEQTDFSKFQSSDEEDIVKIDLSQPPPKTEEDVQQETTSDTEDSNVQEEVAEEKPIEEEVVEQVPEENTEGPVDEVEEEYIDLPENLQKLMEFMEETGGDINDYVKLNQDIENMDDSNVLQDYFEKTKPHLNAEEINFLMEDRFSYDADSDEERDVKRKKLALKEQVAEARAYLDGQKSKYYEDIKAGSKLTSEQQKAIDFFDRYNQEKKKSTNDLNHQKSTFLNKTDKVFNDNFKGFEFNIGDKKVTYEVSDVEKTKSTQVDINNFVGKFLNDQSLMEDAEGYHKSLFTAMNPDAIANHFYEQGKTDAIKQSVSNDKNINTSRSSHKVYEGDGGIKFKVIDDDPHDGRLRYKKRNIN